MILKIAARTRMTGHNASIFATTQGEEPHIFYSGAGDGWLVRWDLNEPELGRLVAEASEQVFSLAYLPQTHCLVAGTMNGQINWIDLNDSEKTKRLAFHKNGVYDLQLDGDQLFSLAGDGMLSRWNIESQRPVESLKLSNERLRSISFSKSRNEIAVGASDGNIYLLDRTNFQLKTTIKEAHELSAFSVLYSPDGKSLVSGGRDAMLKQWKLEETPKLIQAIPAHRYTINDMTLDVRGRFLATGSRDRTIKIWDAQSLELLKVLESPRDNGHQNSVNRLLWCPFKDFLISASDDRSMIIWELAGS